MNTPFGQNITRSTLGRKASEPESAVKLPSLEDMLKDLVAIQDDAWGEYAFSREPLNGKFDAETRYRLILRADECGSDYADRMIARHGQITPYELAAELNLSVKLSPKPAGGGHVIFAQFVEPNKITVFTDCVDKADDLLAEQKLASVVGNLDVKQTLLAHEIFHYLEESDKATIFTKTEKVQLWAIKPFHYQSGIVCLGQIAGMAFAKRLLNMPYSPYVLDVFLVYLYNHQAAYGLYQEIMRIIGGGRVAMGE